MSVNAIVSINFTAESVEEVNAVIEQLNLPEGAMVSATASQEVAAGFVTDGKVVAPDFATPPPPAGGPTG